MKDRIDRTFTTCHQRGESTGIAVRRTVIVLLPTSIISLAGISMLNMVCLWTHNYSTAPDLPLVSYGSFGLCLNLMAEGGW
ncbi:MAG: hypothetical protein ACOC6C_01600 [Verrucomicrobiota bacterium]